jgi:hypothetical protein
MPLYEVAIIEHADPDNDKKERLALPPKAVLARDDQSAAISAVLDAKELDVDRDRMEVLVRPFA